MNADAKSIKLFRLACMRLDKSGCTVVAEELPHFLVRVGGPVACWSDSEHDAQA